MLFTLYLVKPVKGMVAGPVRAVPTEHWRLFCVDETGAHVAPDRDAIRHCLPACYRKAWDRAVRKAQNGGENYFCYPLKDARGRYLNTVYAVPCKAADNA